MLCPVCKSEVSPNQKFCENCGAPVQVPAYPPTPVNPQPAPPAYPSPQPEQPFYQNNPAVSPIQPPVPQNTPYPQPTYQQPSSFNNNHSNYSGTMPITNGNNQIFGAMPAIDPTFGGVTPTVKNKPFMTPKKIIIISVIALLVVIIGVFSFILIRKKIEYDYIVQNPTLSSFSSIEKYLDNTSKNDPIYAFVKNAKTGATLSVKADGNLNKSRNQTNGQANAIVGFDSKSGRYYIKFDGGSLMKQYSGSDTDNNSLVELGIDPDKLAVNYDFAGKSGKYYMNNKTFRQEIANSIFAYNKDNVLNFQDEAAFNAFVDAYESTITQITKVRNNDNDLTDSDHYILNIVKSIEKNGNVTVQDGMANLYNGTELSTPSADVITYTFTKTSVKMLLSDIKSESKNYITKTIRDKDQVAEINSNIESSMEEAIQSLDSSLSENFRLVMRVYLDKNNHSILQQTLEMAGMGSSQSDSSFSMNVQYLHSPNPMIKASLESKDGSTKNAMNFVLSKTDDGNVLTYTLHADLKPNNTNAFSLPSSVPSSVQASFSYNRSAQKYTIDLGTDEDGAHVSYTGDAVINKDLFSLSLNKIVNTNDAELSLLINLSATPPPSVNIAGSKDFLKLTLDEWNDLSGSGHSQPSYYDNDDNDYNGFYYDY